MPSAVLGGNVETDMNDDTNWSVRQYLGDAATEQDAEQAIKLALAIWQEQIDAGIGNRADDEWPTRANVRDWLDNRTYDWTRLVEAARGDVGALAEVRTEAGLSVL